MTAVTSTSRVDDASQYRRVCLSDSKKKKKKVIIRFGTPLLIDYYDAYVKQAYSMYMKY